MRPLFEKKKSSTAFVFHLLTWHRTDTIHHFRETKLFEHKHKKINDPLASPFLSFTFLLCFCSHSNRDRRHTRRERHVNYLDSKQLLQHGGKNYNKKENMKNLCLHCCITTLHFSHLLHYFFSGFPFWKIFIIYIR